MTENAPALVTWVWNLHLTIDHLGKLYQKQPGWKMQTVNLLARSPCYAIWKKRRHLGNSQFLSKYWLFGDNLKCNLPGNAAPWFACGVLRSRGRRWKLFTSLYLRNRGEGSITSYIRNKKHLSEERKNTIQINYWKLRSFFLGLCTNMLFYIYKYVPNGKIKSNSITFSIWHAFLTENYMRWLFHTINIILQCKSGNYLWS